jgi:hypothetical protein
VPRYRSTFQLDDPFAEDGDVGFLGIDEQTEPTNLPQGIITKSENARFQSGKIYTRKGLKKITGITGGKCLVPFLNPNSQADDLLVVTKDSANGLLASGTEAINFPYSDSDEVMGIQAFDKVILFSEGDRPKVWNGTAGSGYDDLPSIPSITDGTFVVCPNAPFGTYINNRLIVPNYADSPTSVICSDILNENLFQLATGEFFLNKGTADKTMGLGVMQESQLLVFNKKSIHAVNNIHTLDSSTSEISRQYGIAGHKAYAQNGAYTYFVSNEGNIQVLVPTSDANKGMGIAISKMTLDQNPLSKNIINTMSRVNLDVIEKSIVHYNKNLVYFFLAIDDSTSLNSCIVYDSLNSQFISLDTLPVSVIDVQSVGGKLYILTDDSVYEYEGQDTDDSSPITLKVKSRDYILGTRDIKKFTRGTLGFRSFGTADLEVKINTRNPEANIVTKQINTTDSAEQNRFNIRKRGYAVNVEIESTGQIEINSLSIEGFVSNGRMAGTY